ncbi:MAG TPA: pilus assembly PilX N-terminal domain-containing protein [Candidatus Saccharimonadales bacterium]|nr:pilus assembly PilX N-terminal domain-containing protein [Candidatus Saccharimonadales bacterium]
MSGNRKGFDERGMVSFLVTMIMMLVITLIVVGFSQVTRRNAREALDRQLSSQAFYAAESGINVTQANIVSYINTNGYASLATKTTCANEYDPVNALGTVPIAPLSGGVAYTCVLVDPTPASLQFSATQTDSAVVPVVSDANMKSITVSWSLQDGGSKTTCAGATNNAFTPLATWGADCDLGVVRIDLVSNPSANATAYTPLDNNTTTVFLNPRGPHNGAVTVGFGGAITARLTSGVDATTGVGGCTSGVCKVKINLPDNTKNYALRVNMLYKDSKTVTITGVNDSGPAIFYGAQAVVDVTGQDQDELRRIQARVSLASSGSHIPSSALASGNDICKDFMILPTDTLDLSTVDQCN